MSKRIIKEISKLEEANYQNISAQLIDNNLYKWKAIIIGPEGTPYANGKFELLINIPIHYPHKPPHIVFITKIFHPNISLNGNICLDILKHKWSPALNIGQILLSISSLLSEPNPSDPLNSISGHMMIKKLTAFDNEVKKYITKYFK